MPATNHDALDRADEHTPEPAREKCTSVYATSAAGGRRSLRRLDGGDGLRTFGGRARTVRERDDFRARIVTGRFGAIDLSMMKHTAHAHANKGTNFGHNHPVSRLVIGIEGHGTARIGRQTFDLEPGTGLLVPGHTPVSYETNGSNTRLHLDLAVDDRAFAAHLDGAPVAHWAARSPVLDGLAAFGQTVLRHDDSRASWAERAEVRRALEALAVATVVSAPPIEDSDGVDRSARSLTLDYIRMHHTDPRLTPAEVARKIGVSVRTVQRAFKDERGVAEWIAQFRLDHAIELLRDERFAALTMAEVAERAGYGSTICMRRAVSAATGQSPAAFRRLHVPPT